MDKKILKTGKKKHPTKVTGYELSPQELSKTILSMRYDKVSEFFKHCTNELQRQSARDCGRKRHQLSLMLDESANETEKLQRQFAQIFELCKPHMKNEFK